MRTTDGSKSYKELLQRSYELQPGETRIPVGGKPHELCPSDGCTVVLQEHLIHLEGRYLCWDPHGYVLVKYKDLSGNPRRTGLHIYVATVIEGREVEQGRIVHHINHLRFHNAPINLEVTTYAHNNAAKSTKSGTTSLYFGVGWHKASNKWLSKITVARKRVHLGLFEDEAEAAKAYDIAFVAVHGSVNGTNKLLGEDEVQEILADREQFVPKAKKADRELPKHMSLSNDVYIVKFAGHNIFQRFDTFEEADKFLQETLTKIDAEEEARIRAKPILRDQGGVAIIPVRILKTQEYLHAKVDDANYYPFVRKPWFVGSQGYPQTGNVLMHSLVHPHGESGKTIDHANTDKMDNRSSNLRLATVSLQGRNKRKRPGCSSNYIGVRKSGNRWRAHITDVGVTTNLGTYITEEAAANAYKIAAQKLYEREGIEYVPISERVI
jgi:hypothetical protein